MATMTPPPTFPPGFLWGAATSAYQIEGSPLADGAGPGIWHRFVHTPGHIADGGTGDVACDHYRRWGEDIALMRRLGIRAYRFGVAWTRIFPDGTDRPNPRGLDFYARLVDGLREAGIEPVATLYHWDLPAALDDRGGWLNPDSAAWFADFSRHVVAALGDRVGKWITLNEPWVVVDGGYVTGQLAPGHRDRYEAPRVLRHLLLAHAEAVRAMRGERDAEIGIAVNIEPKVPSTDGADDRRAAALADAYMNRCALDPVLLGRFPGEWAELFGDAWPDGATADAKRIVEPLDFIGLNYYTRAVVRAEPSAWPVPAAVVPQPGPHTAMGWEVWPQGLADTLDWLRTRYGNPPVYITENGAAFDEPDTVDREPFDDRPRVEYLRGHLGAVHDAIVGGCDVRGYFAWSLLDNFEWAFGYTKRFGIVHVDYATQTRTLKASAEFYSRVIAANGGVDLEITERPK
ncbi:MAG: GH1 family beta-glucosidase [Lysobacterales bacterium]